MTQSGLSDFSSPGDADDGTRDSMETEREDMAAQEAAVVAGGGRGHVSDVVDVDEAKFPESTGTVELMITQIDYAVGVRERRVPGRARVRPATRRRR